MHELKTEKTWNPNARPQRDSKVKGILRDALLILGTLVFIAIITFIYHGLGK